jgi:hypothetical protein
VRPRHSTLLHLAHLVERVRRNLHVKGLTGVYFLDVGKFCDTVWTKGLLYKLTILKVPYFLVKVISSFADTHSESANVPNILQSATFTLTCGLSWPTANPSHLC